MKNIEAMKVEGPLHVVCQCDKCKAEKQEPRCMGTNFHMPDADNHSPECILETAESQGWSDAPEAVEARQAIAEAEAESLQQEPVAWRGYNWGHSPDDWVYRDFDDPILDGKGNNVGQPLYTHPQPKREWVGLTDEEIDKTFETQVWDAKRSYARAIEAKLKEKNNG